MKIRTIRLENVRQFIDPVEIDDIRDGLNVLSIPNEGGKTTVFDALHAVFFKKRNSRDKTVQSLTPHVGGEPSVTVDIELADGMYRIVKSWSKTYGKGRVRVFKSGRLIKQADDAEGWISETLKSPEDGGPAGLLWVRQGATELDRGPAMGQARRDLLTSVAGEVEAMTGGRRMDAARDRCQQELKEYQTLKGRPKTGGLWKNELDKVAALQAKHEELADISKLLREELDRRQELREELANLDDPKEKAQRKARVDKAKASHAEASRHADKLENARIKERGKHAETEQAKAYLETLEKSLSEFARADEAYRVAREKQKQAAEKYRLAEAKISVANEAHKAANDCADSAKKVLRRALRAQSATAADEHREDLIENLKKAEELQRQIEQETAEIEIEVPQNEMEDIDHLDRDVRVIRGTRDVESAAVMMNYTTGRSEGVFLNGETLREGKRTPIPDGAKLDVEDLGQLVVYPGRRAQHEALREAEAKLAQKLEDIGVGSIDDARSSAQRSRDADARRRGLKAELLGIAPKGVDALRRRIAEIPKQENNEGGLPTVDDAQNADEVAQRRLADANATLAAASAELGHAEATAAGAVETAEAAEARVRNAKIALSGIDDPEIEKTRRIEALANLRSELSEAAQMRRQLAESAPDLDAAAAALERANSIIDRADKDRLDIHVELGKLDASIDLRSGNAVEEELADVETRLEMAQRALHDIQFEIDVLRKLDATLKAARMSARDRYVQPVLEELGPLLNLFWPAAKLRLDATEVLPETLMRGGTEENFEILSSGTQEQIALLVRIAFARMLAKTDAAAPVILDDAIIYTDDRRIETMFNTLTRQAHDLQIIVFSCRQKAFRDLGGHGLSITRVGPE